MKASYSREDYTKPSLPEGKDQGVILEFAYHKITKIYAHKCSLFAVYNRPRLEIIKLPFHKGTVESKL